MKQIILAALMGLGAFTAGAQRNGNGQGQWQDNRYGNGVTVINNSASCADSRMAGRHDRGRHLGWYKHKHRNRGYQQAGNWNGNQQGGYGQQQGNGWNGQQNGNTWNSQTGQQSGGGRSSQGSSGTGRSRSGRQR